MAIKPEYEAACRYVLASVKNVTNAVGSIQEFFTHTDNPFAVFGKKEQYLDLRSGEEEICLYFGLSFWLALVTQIIDVIMTVLRFAFTPVEGFRSFVIVSSVLSAIFTVAIMLVLSSAFVYLSSTYSGAWKTVIAKIFGALLIAGVVISSIEILVSVVSLLFGAIKIIASFSSGMLSIVANIFSLAENALSLGLCFMAFNGLNKGIEYHS